MKKRNLILLSAIAAASVLMSGCGFFPDDSGDSQVVTTTPEAAEATATPIPTITEAPSPTPTPEVSPTPAATDPNAAAATDGATADGTTDPNAAASTDGTASADGSSDTAAASSGDASSGVGSTLSAFMGTYGTPIDYEPAYDANGNEVGGVYSFNDFSITTNFIDYSSETVVSVDYY